MSSGLCNPFDSPETVAFISIHLCNKSEALPSSCKNLSNHSATLRSLKYTEGKQNIFYHYKSKAPQTFCYQQNKNHF